MPGNEIVNRQVNIFIQSGEAQKAYDKLIEKQRDLNKRISETTDKKVLDKLKKDLAALEEPISRAAKKVKGELDPSLREMQSLVNNLGSRLKRMSTQDADFSTVLKQYKEANVQLQHMRANVNATAVAQRSLLGESTFGRVTSIAKGFLLGGSIESAFGKVQQFVGDSVKEFLDAEEKTNRLFQSLETLGRTEAFDRLVQKSENFKSRFKFLDDEDIQEAFSKMLDFGNITEKQMTELTQVIIDFSVKTKQSIPDATDEILNSLSGKLGPNIKRLGINFRDTVTDADKLNVILTQLKSKVDGAAEAFGSTRAGRIAQFKQGISDTKEEVGQFVVNFLPEMNEKVEGFATRLVSAFRSPKQVIQDLIDEARAANEIFGKLGVGIAGAANNKGIAGNLVGQGASKAIETLQDMRDRLEKMKLTLDHLTPGTQKFITQAKEIVALEKQIEKITNPGKKDPAAEKLKQRNEEVLKLLREAQAATLSGYEKDLAALDNKYTEERIKSAGNKKQLTIIEEAYQLELAAIQKKWTDKFREDLQNQHEKDKQAAKKQAEELTKIALEGMKDRLNALEKAFITVNRSRLAALELNVLKTQGQKKLDAELALLKEQERQELLNKELTENEKFLIEEKYRQKRKEAEVNHVIDLINTVSFFLKGAADIDKIFSDARTARENNELEQDRRRNDKKKEALDKRLKNGVISQREYDRQLAAIEAAREAKENAVRKRQFERDKRAQFIAALLNNAGAITTTLKMFGPPIPPNFLGILAMALTVGTGIAQLAVIANQKFAKGGKLGGHLHTEGGNPILDKHGHKIGEIEKNEGIVNRHSMGDRNTYTATGTPSQIASGLNALHGGVQWDPGARLIPSWRNSRPVPMNFANINRYYAGGGKFDSSNSSFQQTDNSATLALLTTVVASMDSTLKDLQVNGIPAYLLLSQKEKQEARIKAIREDATLKGS